MFRYNHGTWRANWQLGKRNYAHRARFGNPHKESQTNLAKGVWETEDT